MKKMSRLNLGDFCKECLCAECSRRKYCATMEGNTDWYCHNECEGQCGIMKQCSEFTPIKEGPDTGKEDDESDHEISGE